MAPRLIISGPPANPLLQFLYLVVGALLLVGAIFMGAIILTIVVGLALVLGVVFWIRVWWLKRKITRAATQGRAGRVGDRSRGDAGGVEITDVEYTVVRETRPRDRRD